MLKKIAILEDDLEAQALIKNIFSMGGYDVSCYSNSHELINESAIHAFDVFLLSQDSPDVGIEVIRFIRDKLNIKSPIVFLSEEQSEDLIVKALSFGADDFIAKPFSPTILQARVGAILRRANQFERPSQISKNVIINLGNYELNLQLKKVRLNGSEIKLTEQEFGLAWFYFSHLNETISRQTVIDTVFIKFRDKETRIVDACTTKIRKKLMLIENGFSIETIFRFGYRFQKVF